MAIEKYKLTYASVEQILKDLATVSGGRYYDVATIDDAKQVFANIAEELRPGQHRPRREVSQDQSEISKPGVVLRARPGYRAPADDDVKGK